MANYDGDDEAGWIKILKSGGSVPFLDLENCPNGWASPPGDKFMVRGPDYFSTKIKIPAGDYLLKPLGFDWIRSSTKMEGVLQHPNNRVRKALEQDFPDGEKPFLWAFNLQVPSKENYSAIAYFTSTKPIPEGTLVHQFITGDERYKTSRLKLIANIVKGPWIVRKAVGEQAICVIGRALSCKYSVAENYIEVDIDIGSSVVASAIVHLAFGYVTSLTIDLAFLIESQTESELPEQILGAFRISELNPASAELFEMFTEANSISRQSSLPTRLWKSLGQGLSHLIHTNNQDIVQSDQDGGSTSFQSDQEGGSTSSSHANSVSDDDDDFKDAN